MSCVLEVNDLANVWTDAGIIAPVTNLSLDQTVGILAALEKNVNQASTAITDLKGLGTYGLLLRDLQQTGVVKKGIAATGTLETILSDTSIYTGKYGVNTIDNLLGNKGLQLDLITEVMNKNLETLRFQGTLTGNETDEVTAAVAGTAAKYSIDEIKTNLVTDTLGNITGFLDDNMDILAKLAAFGAVLAIIKNADILGKIKGIAGAVVSLPELATDTIDDLDLRGEYDKFVGSKKIPSATDATKSAGEVAASGVTSVTDTISKGTSSIPKGLL